jgi:spore germination protein YaaH/sugar lactone lactonase YvrE
MRVKQKLDLLSHILILSNFVLLLLLFEGCGKKQDVAIHYSRDKRIYLGSLRIYSAPSKGIFRIEPNGSIPADEQVNIPQPNIEILSKTLGHMPQVSIQQLQYEQHIGYMPAEPPPPWPNKALLKPLALTVPQSSPLTNKEVFGFLPYWEENSTTLSDMHWELLTTVAYFSVGLNSDGTLSDTNNPAWNSSTTANWIAIAHQHGVKVIMTITSFNSSTFYSVLQSYKTALANNALTLVKQMGGDGVAIDFEGWPDNTQKTNLTTLMQILYNTFSQNLPGSIVAIATPAVDWTNTFDYKAISQYADEFIMGYDYHYAGGNPGPVAPLSGGSLDPNYNVTNTLNTYLNSGADPRRLILGVPYYGYDWPSSSCSFGATKSSNGTAIVYYPTCYNDYNNSGYTSGIYQPTTEDSAYSLYNCSTTPHQAWYDISTTLSDKYQLAINDGIKGIGMWALGYDNGAPTPSGSSYPFLWNKIYADFSGTASTDNTVWVNGYNYGTPTFSSGIVSGQVILTNNTQNNWTGVEMVVGSISSSNISVANPSGGSGPGSWYWNVGNIDFHYESRPFTLSFNDPNGINFWAIVAVYAIVNAPIQTNIHGTITKIDNSLNATTLASGLGKPWGIVYNPAGYLYTSNSAYNLIDKISLTGTVSIAYTSSLFMTPTGMVYDAAGNLYVANNSSTGSIVKIDTTGNITTFLSAGLSYPQGMAYANGYLYVANWTGTITQVNLANATLKTFATGFTNPTGIAYNPIDGFLYVVDATAGTLNKLSTTTGTWSVLAAGFASPYGVAIDGGGNIYITCYGNNSVYKVTGTGIVSTYTSSNIVTPVGLTFDNNGNLYIANN